MISSFTDSSTLTSFIIFNSFEESIRLSILSLGTCTILQILSSLFSILGIPFSLSFSSTIILSDSVISTFSSTTSSTDFVKISVFSTGIVSITVVFSPSSSSTLVSSKLSSIIFCFKSLSSSFTSIIFSVEESFVSIDFSNWFLDSSITDTNSILLSSTELSLIESIIDLSSSLNSSILVLSLTKLASIVSTIDSSSSLDSSILVLSSSSLLCSIIWQSSSFILSSVAVITVVSSSITISSSSIFLFSTSLLLVGCCEFSFWIVLVVEELLLLDSIEGFVIITFPVCSSVSNSVEEYIGEDFEWFNFVGFGLIVLDVKEEEGPSEKSTEWCNGTELSTCQLTLFVSLCSNGEKVSKLLRRDPEGDLLKTFGNLSDIESNGFWYTSGFDVEELPNDAKDDAILPELFNWEKVLGTVGGGGDTFSVGASKTQFWGTIFSSGILLLSISLCSTCEFELLLSLTISKEDSSLEFSSTIIVSSKVGFSNCFLSTWSGCNGRCNVFGENWDSNIGVLSKDEFEDLSGSDKRVTNFESIVGVDIDEELLLLLLLLSVVNLRCL